MPRLRNSQGGSELMQTQRHVEIDVSKEIERRFRYIYRLIRSLKEGEYWGRLYYYEVPELEKMQKTLLELIEKRSETH
jgi:hypothetical protein